MKSERFSIISILTVLAVIFSFTAVLIPAQPVNAVATSVLINQPTTDNVTLTKGTGGLVTVKYYLIGTNVPETVHIYITNGSTNIYDSGDLSRTSDNVTLYSEACGINAAAAGNYYLNFYVNGALLKSQSGTTTVIIDNTAPSVSVALPNASNCWKDATNNTIQWAATDAASTDNVTVYAYLSINSGSTYPTTILSGVSYAQGTQIFSYPTAIGTSSSTCKVLVYAVDKAGNISDNATSSLFSILNTGPVPVVTSPNGGEIWNGGESKTITGTITGTGTTVWYMLELQVGGVPTENITPSWVAATLSGGVYPLSHAWTVSNNVCSNACKIRLMVKDCANNTLDDLSNANFTIKDSAAPTVTMTRPTTGQTWYCGTSENITWTQSDNVAGTLSYTLYYTLDGGATPYLWLGSGTSALSSVFHTWSIPLGTNSTNCKIKLIVCDSCLGVTTCTTVYSDTFSIVCDSTPPTVTVCSPNGGENWAVGSTHAITWTASDSPDATAKLTYTIQLSTDSGATFPTTLAVLPNQIQCSLCSCTYSWAVSDNISSTVRIRVTATDPANNSSSDMSNANFQISAGDCPMETTTVILYPGWNLVSLPIIPTNSNLESVLSSVLANVDVMWYFYNCSDSGVCSYYTYTPGGFFNSLTTLEVNKAYWIKLLPGAATYTWTYQGRKCPCGMTPPTYPITAAGWNMIGFKSTTQKAVQTYFASLNTCGTDNCKYMVPVYGYNGLTQQWTSPGCTDNLTPGGGYWLYMRNTTGAILSPGCD